MSDRQTILIVEDDELYAMDLVAAVQDLDKDVAGPVASVTDALALIEGAQISGALLDVSLLDRDVTPLALRLIDLAVPFIIHTGVGLPAELAAAFPYVAIIMKPAEPIAVVRQLIEQLDDIAHHRAGYVGDGSTDEIERIATALHRQFGDRAVVIARRQAVGGTPLVSDRWSAIIARLDLLGAA